MPLIQPWTVPPLRGAVRSLCLGLAMGGVLAVGAPAPATLAQEAAATQEVTVELTPEAARIAALQALHSDRLDAARRLSLALLQRNPDDMTALMIMAVAGAKTGHNRGQKRLFPRRKPRSEIRGRFVDRRRSGSGGQGPIDQILAAPRHRNRADRNASPTCAAQFQIGATQDRAVLSP